MRKTFTHFFLTALCALGLTTPLQAQTLYTQVPNLTGFNQDIVANGQGPVTGSTTIHMDGLGSVATVSYCYMDPTFRTPAGAAPISSLPGTGIITSITLPGLTFQMQSYSANNSLRISNGGTGSGTLTLQTPRSARNLYVLAASGNSPSTVTMTVNFTDGTSQIFPAQTVQDWYGGVNNVAVRGVSRVNYYNNVIENTTTEPRMYHNQLTLLPANYGKLIQSIRFDKTSTIGTLNVMGLTVGTGCPTAPAGGQARASVTSICGSQPVTLSLTGSSNDTDLLYQWQSSVDGGTTWTDVAGATTATYTATPTVTTQYRARLTCGVLTGTSTSITVTVTIPRVTLTYGAASFCQFGNSAAPTASPAGGTFSGTSGLVLNSATGIIDLTQSTPGAHTVTYVSGGQCSAQATATLTIVGAARSNFPNIITPGNKDKLNDSLSLKLPTVEGFEIQIYNRWGRKVWESTDPKRSWTAEDSPGGVYYYYVRFADCTGRRQEYRSWVEVIK